MEHELFMYAHHVISLLISRYKLYNFFKEIYCFKCWLDLGRFIAFEFCDSFYTLQSWILRHLSPEPDRAFSTANAVRCTFFGLFPDIAHLPWGTWPLLLPLAPRLMLLATPRKMSLVGLGWTAAASGGGRVVFKSRVLPYFVIGLFSIFKLLFVQQLNKRTKKSKNFGQSLNIPKYEQVLGFICQTTVYNL